MGNVYIEITMSLDGFVAGPNVRIGNGMGDDGESLHGWMSDKEAKEIMADFFEKTGAFIIGRRMFDVGEEPWGDDGAFGKPCFVLTNRPREILVKGPTTFTFVTGGIHQCLELAQKAAGDKNVGIAGGANIIQEFLNANLVDELRLHVAPVMLRAGTRLFDEITRDNIRLEQIGSKETASAMHTRYRVSS